jgi:hypothetical protein
MSKRHGKVARLPQQLRSLVNQCLEDGRSYKEIIAKLDIVGPAAPNPRPSTLDCTLTMHISGFHGQLGQSGHKFCTHE